MRAAIANTAVATAISVIAASCSNNTGIYSGAQAATILESVAPAGGATGVSPTASVVITFSSATRSGMEFYVSIHQGTVTGPTVTHAATWSPDHSTLILTPDSSLTAGKPYTIHIGGGIVDKFGNAIDMAQKGPSLGGQWANADNSSETGVGWLGSNGHYEMLFTFST